MFYTLARTLFSPHKLAVIFHIPVHHWPYSPTLLEMQTYRVYCL
jgi:hypothetical protein